MPSMTRTFSVASDLHIALHEPSLTEDNLGLKTWTSSLLLARRLPELHKHLPTLCTEILELGAGTGLVGIAAAYTWNVHVTLTDLPEIVPNLQHNVKQNANLDHGRTASMTARPLDWAEPMDKAEPGREFLLILAADPIYSPNHPALLVSAVRRWLKHSPEARFIVELPLRQGYTKERETLRDELLQSDMELVEEGTEVGYDDWQSEDGQPSEVECWWSVWRPNNAASIK